MLPDTQSSRSSSDQEAWRVEPQTEYVTSAQQSLKNLWRELLLLDSKPDELSRFRPIVQLLGELSQEAEAWGFAEVERVTLGLRDIFLDLESGSRCYDARMSKLLMQGLELVSELIREAEKRFERNNFIDALLDSLAHPTD